MLLQGNSKTVTLEQRCPICRKTYTFKVDTEGFTKWYLDGELVQVVLPKESSTIREHLVSGLCEDCQKSIFSK